MQLRGAGEYITSDLALEGSGVGGDSEGVLLRERAEGDFTVTSITVQDERGERAVGRPVGSYVTITLGKPWLLGDEEFARATDILARELRDMCRAASSCESVLVIGLGNRAVTADALGPLCADGLLITRHIKLHEEALFREMAHGEVASFAPGVLAQTGIETLELVRGAVERVKPSLVIVIDALAARGVGRLATTVQLCDTGIAPGSGIGNTRAALDRSSLGVPVIALGAPTVVNSATLVLDALELAGIEEVSPELEKVLENGRSFFVSLKESDVAVRELSRLISGAVNTAFTNGTPEDGSAS